jgi:hypothetical protein
MSHIHPLRTSAVHLRRDGSLAIRRTQAMSTDGWSFSGDAVKVLQGGQRPHGRRMDLSAEIQFGGPAWELTDGEAANLKSTAAKGRDKKAANDGGIETAHGFKRELHDLTTVRAGVSNNCPPDL